MEQTVLARHELYEAAVRHDAADRTLVDLTNLRDGDDSLDLGDSGVDDLLVRTADLNLTNSVFLIDGDDGTSILLHLLDDLSTRTNHRTNELLRNLEGLDTWYLWLQLRTWLGDGVCDALQDVLTTSLCLHQRFLQDIERQTVTLDIHLGSGQTVLGTSGLEVHITQVILITEDITQYGILVLTWVLDQTHGDTRDGFLHRYTSVHQGKGTGTYGSHRRGTVRLQDL